MIQHSKLAKENKTKNYLLAQCILPQADWSGRNCGRRKSFCCRWQNGGGGHRVLEKAFHVVGAGEIQRGLALLVFQGRVSSVGQEQSAELGPALLGRLVQWGEAPLVGGVDNCGVLDEEGGNVKMAVGAGVVERDQTTLVLCVYIRALNNGISISKDERASIDFVCLLQKLWALHR